MLHIGTKEHVLKPGMSAGFKAKGQAHHLHNCSHTVATILEVGSRVEADQVSYPEDDLVAVMDTKGQWSFEHKNGQTY